MMIEAFHTEKKVQFQRFILIPVTRIKTSVIAVHHAFCNGNHKTFIQ